MKTGFNPLFEYGRGVARGDYHVHFGSRRSEKIARVGFGNGFKVDGGLFVVESQPAYHSLVSHELVNIKLHEWQAVDIPVYRLGGTPRGRIKFLSFENLRERILKNFDKGIEYFGSRLN